jgi:CYTH domain-containing protein
MAGGWEIERRYLVRVTDALWSGLGPGHHLRQGYVATGASFIRIREGEPRGPVLTIKNGRGVKRREVETVVPSDVADALFGLAAEHVLEKVRFRIGPWELDRFLGPLGGLSLLEIELEAVDQWIPDAPDGVSILREVTDDNRFTNNYLAGIQEKAARAFVRAVYAEVGP